MQSRQDFQNYNFNNWSVSIDKDYSLDDLKEIASAVIDKAFFNNDIENVPASEFAQVYKTTKDIGSISRTYYIKKFLHRSAVDIAKHFFRPSRARRFFDACLMLNDNGFNTPKIVALGEIKKFGVCVNNFIITEEISNSVNMYDTIDQTADLKELAKQLGQIVGQMHAKGIFHGDLRLGNILVQNNNGQYKFYLLDNERTRKFNRLPRKLIIKNLVQLNMLYTDINSTIKMKFIKNYCPENWKQHKATFKKVICRTNHRLCYKKIKKQSKNDFIGNENYFTIQNKNYKCKISNNIYENTDFNIDHFIENIDKIMQDSEIIKTDRKTTLSKVVLNEQNIVIKRYNYISILYSILHYFERSRALRSFRFGNLLLQISISTPKPLGYIEIKKLGITLKSYVITEFTNDKNLHSYKTERLLSQTEWASILGKIKRILNIMTRYQISHGDIKASNILVGNDHILITDLDAMKIHKTRLGLQIRRTKDITSFNKKIVEKYS